MNKYNIDLVSDMIVSAASSCEYYAVDTEFSGLDSGDDFRSKNLETRYGAFRNMVERYALLQLGICFVKPAVDGRSKSVSFTFQVVSMDRYTVAPHSMIFLAEHGLSLTDCYKRGIPFTPPSADEHAQSKLESLWRKIVSFRKPLVMHNGLADLLFIWRSFFGPLPATLSKWIGVMSTSFPAVYDTKYLADTVAGDEASYLQHLFRLSAARSTVVFDSVAVPEVFQIIQDKTVANTPTEVCNQFARHGNCRRGLSCPHSHDVDFIVHVQEAKRLGTAPTRTSRPNNSGQRNEKRPQMMHSAGFDAYATAFVFASFKKRQGESAVAAAVNHLNLMWHDRPLLFVKSKYE